MNLPNILTLSRIFFGVLIAYLLLVHSTSANIAALVLFVIASITDFYDGYIAKKQGLISDFGKIMDPIADKILMFLIFCALANLGIIDWWMVVVITIREVAVTVSRLKAMKAGRVLAAEAAGKVKTVCQITTIIVILLFLIVEQSAFAAGWFYKIEMGWLFLIRFLMFVSIILTVASGVAYFNANKGRV